MRMGGDSNCKKPAFLSTKYLDTIFKLDYFSSVFEVFPSAPISAPAHQDGSVHEIALLRQ
jgi:hypothetical protein